MRDNQNFIQSLGQEIQETEHYLQELYNLSNQVGGGGGNTGFQGRIRAGNDQTIDQNTGWQGNQGMRGRQGARSFGGGSSNTVSRGYPTRGPKSSGEPGRAFSSVRDGGTTQGGIPLDKEGTIDERTREGRDAAAAQDYDEQTLMGFINDAPLTVDGSVDLRTEEGRALHAVGWIDDDGILTEQAPAQGMTAGGNQGGRNFRGRNRNQTTR